VANKATLLRGKAICSIIATIRAEAFAMRNSKTAVRRARRLDAA